MVRGKFNLKIKKRIKKMIRKKSEKQKEIELIDYAVYRVLDNIDTKDYHKEVTTQNKQAS